MKRVATIVPSGYRKRVRASARAIANTSLFPQDSLSNSHFFPFHISRNLKELHDSVTKTEKISLLFPGVVHLNMPLIWNIYMKPACI